MKRLLLVSLAVLTLAAAGAAAWLYWPRRVTFLTDADTIRASEDGAALREILWQPPTVLAELINTSADEYEPRITADGRTLFFVRGRPGENADIYVARRTNDGWTEPQPLSAVNSDDDDLGPEPAADGRALYFYTDRPGGLGGYDLWVSRRIADDWQPPVNLGAHVNSEYNDYGPALDPQRRTLYYASNRPGPDRTPLPPGDAWQATIREDPYQHDYDLYSASISDAGFAPAVRLDRLSSPANDGAPAFSPAGDFLYFSSDRPGGLGGFDLYRARRLAGRFESPTNLGSEINTAANELDPALAMGGYALHFSSDRAASEARAAGRGQYDLYQSLSREVFRRVETYRPAIDWSALWRQIGPSLVWALLALLATLLLLALLRDMKERRLSLLAKCLLASLLVHLLLMLLFNVVEVTTSIASAFRESNRIQISLASAARADELAFQLRGNLTEVETPAAESPPVQRQDLTAELPTQMPMAKLAVDRGEPKLDDASTADVSIPESEAGEATVPEFREFSPADWPTESTDVALPAETAPIDAVESESTVALRPVEDGKLIRAESPVPTTQPADLVRPVELAPERTPDALLGNEPSLAETGPAGVTIESRIEPPSPAWQDPLSARADPVAPALELDVPESEAVRKSSVAESETGAHVPVATAPILRSELTPLPEDSDARLALPVAIEPTPYAANDSTTSLVAMDAASRDAIPAVEAMAARTPAAVQDSPPQSIVLNDAPPSPSAFSSVGPPPLELALPTEIAAPESPPGDAVGTIRGRITDAATGRPLEKAQVQLDLPDAPPVIAVADADGQYALHAPQVPDFFALSASLAGYLPSSQSVPASELKRGRLEVDFALEPVTEQVVAMEAEPRVHHLGNDRFEGRINSQFQRASEGLRYKMKFTLGPDQLSPTYRMARVEMLVKGVQCPHQIRINGKRLSKRIADAPGDGSFGRFEATFDAAILRAGSNTLLVRNVDCREDIDDFEFVNVQLRLIP